MTLSYKVSLAEVQERNAANSIVITGAPRSGTTLLGRLISTLEGIEYHFEPPMVWVIASLLAMKVLPVEAATCLLQAYLHEDLLIESAHGRKANLRPNDDSLILGSLPWQDLLSRWQVIRNRADAVKYVTDRKLRLAFKTPSVLDTIPFFETALPQARFIVIMRDGRDVVRSTVEKQWFTDEGLRDNYWPYKQVGQHRLTHLVEDSMADSWATMNAATRACYLWRRDAEFALGVKDRPSLAERLLLVRYEDLISDPSQSMAQLAQFLATRPTDLTRLGVMSVRKPPEARRSAWQALMSQVRPDEAEKFELMNARWGYT